MMRNPSHKVYERRYKEFGRVLRAEAVKSRLFIGTYPCGIVYADRYKEEHGDYKRLCFLPFNGMEPDWSIGSHHPLYAAILRDVRAMQARDGQEFQVSTAGQAVRLRAVRSAP